MTLYAYLRVSTDMQDVNNQKLGVLEYCAAQKLGMPDMISDTISGKVDWQQHEIGKLLGRLDAYADGTGDTTKAFSNGPVLHWSSHVVMTTARSCVVK